MPVSGLILAGIRGLLFFHRQWHPDPGVYIVERFLDRSFLVLRHMLGDAIVSIRTVEAPAGFVMLPGEIIVLDVDGLIRDLELVFELLDDEAIDVTSEPLVIGLDLTAEDLLDVLLTRI